MQRDEWRSVSTVAGVQYVQAVQLQLGMATMQMLSVDS